VSSFGISSEGLHYHTKLELAFVDIDSFVHDRPSSASLFDPLLPGEVNEVEL
jgi:hypothetical protein